MSCDCENKTITIYQGFSTFWNGKSLISVSFDTDLNLDGFSAIFRISNIEKTYTNIGDGFNIDLTKQETARLPIGLNYGELIIEDNESHKRPFTTALPFNVENWVSGDIHLDNYKLTINTKIKDNVLNIKIETANINPQEIEKYISDHNLDENSHPYILGILDNKVDKVSSANRIYGTDGDGEQTTYDISSLGTVKDVEVNGQSVVNQDGVAQIDLSGKQDVIDDLAEIRSGAAKGATAVQPSAIANMQTTTNLVTEVDDDSTDTQYPSAKAVYNVQLDLEDQLDSEARVRTRMDNQLSDRINNYNTLMLEKVSKCGKATDTMPIVDFDLLNVPIQYKGTTTQDYIYGYFYKFTDPVYSSSVNVRIGSFTVAVNTATFVSRVKKADGYLFRKYDNYWLLDYDLNVYDLEYYGITITGTVNIGDEFVVNISMETTHSRIDVQPAGGAVDSVNGQTGTVVLDASDVGALPDTTTIPTDTSDLTNGAGFITSSALSGYATQTWVGQQGYLTSTALSGYATEQWVGQQGYITGITSQMVTTALGYTPYNGATNPNGYITGITSSMVTSALGYTPYNSTNPAGYTSNLGTVTSVNNVSPVNGNVSLSIPTVNNPTITFTQGGVSKGSITLNQSSDETIALDAGGGSSYTAGTGIDITSNTISVTSPTLTNTATGTNAITILGTATSKAGAINIGVGSGANTAGTSLGNSANAGGSNSISIGASSSASGSFSIQLGKGTNSEANSFYVSTSTSNNWKLLGSDGKIPDGRLPIATSVSSSSTNADVVGAKLFYDTCGDIVTLINAL